MTSSPRRIEANRRNAQKSTGPRTPEGKAISARNGTRHGLTAATFAAVPGEDAADYRHELKRWKAAAPEGDVIAEAVAERACLAAWRLRRAARQEAAVVAKAVRRAADDFEQAERAKAVALGERLLRDPINRCATFRHADPVVARKVEEWRKDDPAVLSPELELTAAGVDWKLERWAELKAQLDAEGYWHYDSRYKAIKLMGRRPEDVLFDPVVGLLSAACNAAHPEPWDLADDAHQATIGTEGRPVYYRRVDALRVHVPPTKEEAVAFLRRTLESEVARLVALKIDKLDARAADDRDGAADRALVDTSPEGMLRVRYEAAASRDFHKALDVLSKQRKTAGLTTFDAPAGRDPAPVPVPAPVPCPAGPPEPGPETGTETETPDAPPSVLRRPPQTPRNEPNGPRPTRPSARRSRPKVGPPGVE